MLPPRPFHQHLDRLLTFAAVLIGLLLVWAALQAPRDSSARTQAAEVRNMELRGIIQEVSETLPPETRAAIGLTGQPLGTKLGVLDDLRKDLAAAPWAFDLRWVWIALATGWHEDALARQAIVDLLRDLDATPAPASASSPPPLNAADQQRLRAALDALVALTNATPPRDPTALTTQLDALSASRWLRGRLEVRALEAAQDQTAAEDRAADVARIADSAVSRKMWAFGIEFGLTLLGLILALSLRRLLLPAFRRRALAADLPPSPFILPHTRRVLLAWFIATQFLGFFVAALFGTFGRGPLTAALSVTALGLLHGALALLLIRVWGLPPSPPATAPSLTAALGLTGPTHLRRTLAWLLPGLALATLVVQVASYLNLLLLGRLPDTQSSIQLVTDDHGLSVTLALAAGAVLVAPLVEELLFRAFLFRNLRATLGRTPAALLSGFIFALVHLQPTLILPLMGLGVALALLYEWSGSIWVPITTHALWNGLMLLQVEVVWPI